MTIKQAATVEEAPHSNSEVLAPEPPVARSTIDTKPVKPSHYDPKTLNVNTFCNIFLEGGVCLAGRIRRFYTRG